MKRVTGWCSVRPIGCYNFDFFVDDNTTDKEIRKMIDEELEYSFHYDVEEGYEEEVTYVKYE